jgi:tRNA threonylcarbamoyladenosine biosynthesis protein TsaB
MLRLNRIARADLRLLIACVGPGGYTGLRVGISVAKTLAYAMGIGCVGVNRLLADAAGRLRGEQPVCAVHRAGRKDLAVAIYKGAPLEAIEMRAPELIPITDLADELEDVSIVTGEVPEEVVAPLQADGHEVWTGIGGQRRPWLVARLGLQAVAEGAKTDPQSLLPVYLRAPVQEP